MKYRFDSDTVLHFKEQMYETNLYQIYSLAGNSTVILWKPNGIMIDCGEGAALMMGLDVFKVSHLFITHGHSDHIMGIVQSINARLNCMGDNKKMLNIYAPDDDNLRRKIDFFLGEFFRPNIPVKMRYINPMNVIGIDGKTSVRPILAHHGGVRALSYMVEEVRERNKPEYSNLAKEEYINLSKQKINFREKYTKKIAFFSGDTEPVNLDLILGTDYIFHEATLLDEEDLDVEKNSHSSFTDASSVCRQVGGAKEIVYYHVSRRYQNPEFLGRFSKRLADNETIIVGNKAIKNNYKE